MTENDKGSHTQILRMECTDRASPPGCLCPAEPQLWLLIRVIYKAFKYLDGVRSQIKLVWGGAWTIMYIFKASQGIITYSHD